MTNRSVAGVVCPVARVILTVVEENHPVAVVACPVARVMQNCVAQVTSKSTVIGSLVDCPFACRIVADHSDEWGNALSGRNNGSQSRLCTICGMFVYNPCCCMKISALHMPVDVYISRYRPAHEAFVDKRNSISYGKGTSRCHCMAIYMKHCVSYIKQTVVWESVARDSSPIREITQLQYAYCMKHTVVSWPFSLGHAYIQQRRLWFLCTLQFLLHRRHHCKHKLAFARTLTLLLLLGGDVETNPGPSKQWLKNQADKKTVSITQVKNLSTE